MTASSGRWLMCRPDFFDVKYEINPWMKVTAPPAHARAASQWDKLYATMLKLGAQVELVPPHKDQPDLVFTANAGLVRGGKCLLSHFRYKERSGEEALFRRWFESNGFEVRELPRDCFEGEGDALASDDLMFAGYGFRSDKAVGDSIREYFGLSRVIPLELIDPYFYHLDTCFCPLPGGRALFCRSAFGGESAAVLEKTLDMWAVPIEEARLFACNSVLLGASAIIPAGCPRTCAKLREWGYEPHEVELDEFIKSGGAAKCLTLRLDTV